MNRPPLGLDFGTTTTLVASADAVVSIGMSLPWMPSLVGYGDDGSIVVGEEALNAPSEQVVSSIKQVITDHHAFVPVDLPTGVRDVRADGLIVEVLREAARRSAAAGHDLTGGARLGCPAMWDGRQRRRLVELARRAGLPVTLASLVDEPVAAGIAWLASHQLTTFGPSRILVFDMGGGTLDIAVLEVRGVDQRDVSVLAALGVDEAGDALDDAIADDLYYSLSSAGVDVDALSNPHRARARLPYAACAAKLGLTFAAEIDVKLSRREFGIGSIVYTREQLNEVFAPQMDRAEGYVVAALQAARLTELVAGTAYEIARTPIETLVEGIDVVVLSGGMSQIPYVAQRLAEFFAPTTRIEMACAPAENAVALGLAKAAQYGRINRYRPGFDVLIEWNDGQESRVVYEAYTPLVEMRQIRGGSGDLRFIRTGRDLSLPPAGPGRFRVVSHSDDPVRANIGGESLDGFPVVLSEQKFEFSIYPNGRIRMIDNRGTYDGHVADWSPTDDHN